MLPARGRVCLPGTVCARCRSRAVLCNCNSPETLQRRPLTAGPPNAIDRSRCQHPDPALQRIAPTFSAGLALQPCKQACPRLAADHLSVMA